MKTIVKYLGLLVISGTIAACSGAGEESSDEAVLTATALGEQTVLPVSEYLAQDPYAAADPDNGERQAYLCRACHSFAEGGAHMIGPNLHGVFGSRVGARGDFDYSAALLEVDFVWTPRALDAWLAEPARFLPGNRMTMAGISDPQDRRDVIAYLMRTTSQP